MLVPLLVALVAGAQPGPLSQAALRARYGNLASLTAEISQTKEGRFWARPMRSRITLRWTPRRVEWETTSPVRSLVAIEGDVLVITDGQGRTRTVAAGDSPQLRTLISLLRDLLSLDLAAIEREYQLEFRDAEVIARLRPRSAVRVFDTLRFRFDSNLDLVGLDLEAESEKTSLSFLRLVSVPREGGGR